MATDSSSTFQLAVGLGIGLVVLGVAASVLTDFASVTSLIPAIFGVLVAILGAVGWRTDRQRYAVYGIGLLAILGVLGSTRGIPDILALLTGESVDSVIASISQGVMIAVCLVLLAAVIQFVRTARAPTNA